MKPLGAVTLCAWMALTSLAAQDTPRSFPAIGIAVEDLDGNWCAQFPRDARPAVTVDAPIAIVLPHVSESLVLTARIAAVSTGSCATAFPQPRWDGYGAYRLAIVNDTASSRTVRTTVGLAVASAVPWRRAIGGALRADLDGDGTPEEARRCAADEGEHFTIWTLASEGRTDRRAHEYFDWGALTEPTCGPGEDGR